MNNLTIADLKKMMYRVSDLIIENEPYLTEIDSKIGDGDHGTGMKRGFLAVHQMLDHSDFDTADELFKAVGIELVKTMGGASGVIFGTLFIGGLSKIKDMTVVSPGELTEFFEAGCLAIQKRGRAAAGQKTMLDALIPAVDAMKKALDYTENMKDILQKASEASEAGAKNTILMKSKAGRSKNFEELSIGLPDPGAVSTSLIFKALYESLE